MRGFRIELEAIEAHLVKQPRVREAACTVQVRIEALLLLALAGC